MTDLQNHDVLLRDVAALKEIAKKEFVVDEAVVKGNESF